MNIKTSYEFLNKMWQKIVFLLTIAAVEEFKVQWQWLKPADITVLMSMLIITNKALVSIWNTYLKQT